jgi:hypothetical protein
MTFKQVSFKSPLLAFRIEVPWSTRKNLASHALLLRQLRSFSVEGLEALLDTFANHEAVLRSVEFSQPPRFHSDHEQNRF